jgi:hypothetical protein
MITLEGRHVYAVLSVRPNGGLFVNNTEVGFSCVMPAVEGVRPGDYLVYERGVARKIGMDEFDFSRKDRIIQEVPNEEDLQNCF